MTIGLLGKKAVMTRVFTEDGASVPVTVIEVEPNRVARVKSVESDGYAAIQVTTGSRKAKHLTKAQAGQFAKAGVEAGRSLMEFRLAEDDEAPEVGGELTVSLFAAGQKIDVTGTSKGKGFQGAMRRHNFHGSPAAHGSMMHRRTGGVGGCSTPGRVWKNQKMPGQMGNAKRTVQNLKVVAVRPEDNVILISGAVPGARGSYLVIRPAKKK